MSWVIKVVNNAQVCNDVCLVGKTNCLFFFRLTYFFFLSLRATVFLIDDLFHKKATAYEAHEKTT